MCWRTMNNYSVGDLVWIPDGTVNIIGMAIAGPNYALVTKVESTVEFKWLDVKIGSEKYTVLDKMVRKIES